MARWGATGQAIAMAILAVLIFTLMDSVAKALTQHYPAFQVVWARNLGQLVILLLVLRGRVPALLRTRHIGSHVLRSLFQFGAVLSFFFALGYIGLAEATAIGDLNPVFITLGAALFLGERLGPRRIAGVVAALIGALIIIRPGMGVFSSAALLPLLAAVFMTGYALVTRRLGVREPVWTPMLYGAIFGTCMASIGLLWYWTPIASQHLLLFCIIGVLGAAAQFCQVRSLMLAEASVVAPFAYVGILFATIWGWLFFDEMPDSWTGVGALVIVAAGLYVWHRETQVAKDAGAHGGKH